MIRSAAVLAAVVVVTACNGDASQPPLGNSGSAGTSGGAEGGAGTGTGGKGTGGAGRAGTGTGGTGIGGAGNGTGGIHTGGKGTGGAGTDTGGAGTDTGDAGTGTSGAGTDPGGAGSGGVSYSTTFNVAATPISENGVWHHDGLDWTLVNTSDGVAFGTQELGVNRQGPEGYNDSYAYLGGFPPDQEASAVIHLGTIDTSCTHEVEVLLRWADSAHDARGYECNLAYDGSYAQIVRWNGPVGDYTYIGSGQVPGGVHDGDVLRAAIVGSAITLSVNGVVRATATDATFATGDPGMGFWRGSSGCGTFGDYGFTSYAASSHEP